MALFNVTYVQNFDAKGRVSVPASFRIPLRAGAVSISANSEGPVSVPLVLRPSEKAQCIEALTEVKHHALLAELEKLDPLSEEYDALATVLFADAWPIETDKEGRIIIHDTLLSHAAISRTGSVAFVGMGVRFQLWNPDNVPGQKALAQSTNRARMARQREVTA
ncbi:MAG TPA: cell division/cell wall cluster transcriptional repressor MraZ [Acetobacteraceae bacterium]|nr:cell division/cell wall cluster transcriptional repressor MraZ [Acetobacteraceae bacterium]